MADLAAMFNGIWQLVGVEMKLYGVPVIYYFAIIAALGAIMAFIRGKK